MKIDTFTAKYGRRKLPKFWDGYENFLNAAVNGLGFGISVSDLANHRHAGVYNPDLQHSNRYEGLVADIMANRMPNEYPVMLDMNNLRAAEQYSINNSPALSAGQRTLANITNSMNTSIGRANALMNMLNIRNLFAKERADMLNNMGQFDAQMRQRDDVFNTLMEAAAAAKKSDLILNDKYNMINYASQFAKLNWEISQFKDLMDLYRQKINGDKKDIQNNIKTPTINLSSAIEEARKDIEKLLPALPTLGKITDPSRLDLKKPTTSIPTGIYKMGSKGDVVGRILSLVGATPDKIYGKNTKAAVQRYLRANSLVPDGIVGPLTLARMFGKQ